MSYYVSSDYHIGHKNIIQYSSRPFESIEEMADTIVNNINKKVKLKDTLYILGDYSFLPFEETKQVTKKIKCNKVLIRGNHDKLTNAEYEKMGFNRVLDYLELKYNKKLYVMSHFPFLVWRNSHHGSRMLCGHSHGNLNHLNINTYRLDVGVDNFNFSPLSLEEVESIMQKRNLSD